MIGVYQPVLTPGKRYKIRGFARGLPFERIAAMITFAVDLQRPGRLLLESAQPLWNDLLLGIRSVPTAPMIYAGDTPVWKGTTSYNRQLFDVTFESNSEKLILKGDTEKGVLEFDDLHCMELIR